MGGMEGHGGCLQDGCALQQAHRWGCGLGMCGQASVHAMLEILLRYRPDTAEIVHEI